MKNRNGTENALTSRPYASEAEIREMYDKAAGHAARASQHEGEALRVVGAAEQDAQRLVTEAQEQAAEFVRKAQEQAAANVAEAQGRAAMIRADRDAEAKGERFWAELAAEEAVRAGLSPLEETLTDGVLGTGEVAQS